MSLPPWLADSWRSLAERIDRGQLPHAVLIGGARGLGKRTLADSLVRAALCESRADHGFACGTCRACHLLAAGSHPDRVDVSFGLRDDGKPRSEITVEQIRELSQRLSLSSQFGGLQLVTLDPADAMNASAANALLKTLEEPSANTVIILVCDRPMRLPATIRSRCQRVRVPAPPAAAARAWLIAQGIDGERADAALAATLGNPGIALAACNDDTLALRDACRRDLAALRGGSGVLAIADAWAADRPAERLWQAAVLARDEALELATNEQARPGLTAADEIPKLAAWFAAANRAREMLDTPLRGELVVLDLLHAWQRSRRT